MDFYSLFKGFLGFPNHNNQTFFDDSDVNDRSKQFFRDDNWTEEDHGSFSDESQGSSHNEDTHFNVFSNPVEMHRYFEHQMNEMLKSFSMFGLGENIFEDPNDARKPALEQPTMKEGNLRDHYLKPGYEHIAKDNFKKDTDVDGKVSLEELDKNFKESAVSQFKEQTKPQMSFFGRSISSKIIRKSDGTQEIHKIVIDQDGNETKTITKQQGEQKYTITTKTDKYGQKEVTEDLINVDENDVFKFKSSIEHPSDKPKPHNWFPFEKFFK